MFKVISDSSKLVCFTVFIVNNKDIKRHKMTSFQCLYC